MSRWWNSRAYDGNWDDGKLHDIVIGLTSLDSAEAMLDNSPIQMVNEGTLSHEDYPRTMPADSQTIFASKSDNAYYMVSSAFKVQRVAYSLNDIVIADFRAGVSQNNAGFFDVIAKTFHAGTGKFILGPNKKEEE